MKAEYQHFVHQDVLPFFLYIFWKDCLLSGYSERIVWDWLNLDFIHIAGENQERIINRLFLCFYIVRERNYVLIYLIKAGADQESVERFINKYDAGAFK